MLTLFTYIGMGALPLASLVVTAHQKNGHFSTFVPCPEICAQNYEICGISHGASLQIIFLYLHPVTFPCE